MIDRICSGCSWLFSFFDIGTGLSVKLIGIFTGAGLLMTTSVGSEAATSFPYAQESICGLLAMAVIALWKSLEGERKGRAEDAKAHQITLSEEQSKHDQVMAEESRKHNEALGRERDLRDRDKDSYIQKLEQLMRETIAEIKSAIKGDK